MTTAMTSGIEPQSSNAPEQFPKRAESTHIRTLPSSLGVFVSWVGNGDTTLHSSLSCNTFMRLMFLIS